MLFQTVTAVNYLPYSFVLARTLKQHVADARLCILVTDASPPVIDKIRRRFGDIAEFIGCDDLGVEALKDMRRYYSVLEFSSACKVLALDYQLRKRGESECCFVDPDMLVMDDFTTVTQAVDKDIVVTYHTLKPYPQDGELPNEMELVTSGCVNGSFIYVRNSELALDALRWLVSHTRHDWFVAPAYGMYGDQHWLGFLLQFFGGITGVLRASGVNIAYWNLHERPLSETAGRYRVGTNAQHPAMLFHFSGFPNKGDTILSKHSNRIFDTETQACLSKLIRSYRQAVDIEQASVVDSGVTGDLSFNNQPLYQRMKLAERLCNHRFIQLTYPAGRFARLGSFIDKLLGQG